MKRIKTFLLGLAIFAFSGLRAGALELEALGGAGNLAFDHEGKSALGEETFNPKSFFTGYVSVKGEYSDFFDFNIRLENDPVLRCRALGGVSFNFNYGKLEMGPLIGFFNTKEQPLSAGVSGGLRLEYPGLVFASLKGSSTLASLLAAPGDYAQSEGDAAFGFWVPNVICAISMNKKDFACLLNEELLTRDEQTRYQFSADVYNKNVPYTLRIDLGYQILKRSYVPMRNADGQVEADEFKTIYGGFEGTWRIIPPLRVILALEMPFYSWAAQPLRKDSEAVFYKAQAGIIWTFDDKNVEKREYPR
jgi:hypothetical protein